MSTNIITISRQFGSGGHTIGEKVGALLKIPFYDQKIIEKTMEKTGFSADYIKEAGEYATSANSLLFNLAVSGYSGRMGTLSPYDEIYAAQRKIICDLAEQGPCVIVGRGADFVLKDRTDCLNVYIHADDESRAKRILERYGENDTPIETRLKEKDRRRQSYYKHYTGREWGNAQNYHLAIDSGKIGVEKSVQLLAELFRSV